ncbi:MAG: hypothetical protein OXI43_02725 [Candidatus Poribacteria bacterium]|nr:hypothetical protein [Candidatus Poribacteria bacterium]
MHIDFEKLNGLRGFLTPQDIADGLQGDCDNCPLALAIGRMFPNYQVNVDPTEITIHQDGETAVKMRYSEKIGHWIDAFDEACEVAPIQLVIQAVNTDGYKYEVALLEETFVNLCIRATVEPIPQGEIDDPVFLAWCQEHNVMPLGGSRRGWFGAVNSYLNDAAYIVHPEDAESGTPFLLSAEAYNQAVIDTLQLAEAEKQSPEQRLTEILKDFAGQIDDEEWKYVPIRIGNTVERILKALGIPQLPERKNTQE